MTQPVVGTDEWVRWVEGLQAEIAELKSRNDATEVIELEARLTKLRTEADTLRGTVGRILNAPKMPREDVQARLLLAVQRYDNNARGT